MDRTNNYTDVYARANEKLEMECTSYGYPAAPILWKSLRTNHFIRPHHFHNFTTNLTSFLVIERPTPLDNGNYSCEILGRLNQKKIFHLTVQGDFF